jgi:dephospho-CoA kinase
MKKRIVVTGNIGTGKSTVTEILAEKGYKVISADFISSLILKDNQEEVSKMFGIRPIQFDSFKKELSNLVFSDKDSRVKLEEFMLPKINEDIDTLSNIFYSNRTPFIIEMPTFFESRGLKKHEDFYVINVVADKALRVQRIMERNKHLSIQDTLDRMKVQINPELKAEYSEVTLDNSGSYEELRESVFNMESSLNV